MKRHGNLWDKITAIENIKLAHKLSRRGKAYYKEVQMVDADIDGYAAKVQKMLLDKTFTTSEYATETRFDGRKERVIHKLPYFPDRIVQHALLNIVGPILVRSMIRDSFQSILGRGTSDAARRVKKLVRSADCPKYALKMDIRKYYPSVSNELLKQEIRRKVKCADTLWLIDDIIDSINGLPIGNYTSQHFGNIFLNRFDWWMKQEVKPLGYFRYCDDIVVFGNSTAELVRIKRQAESRLNELRLDLKPTWNIYNVHKHGVDFVGYVFRPDLTRLRPSIAVKFKAACRRIKRSLKRLKWESSLSALMSYKGWVLPCNAKALWRRHVTQKLRNVFPAQLKGAL